MLSLYLPSNSYRDQALSIIETDIAQNTYIKFLTKKDNQANKPQISRKDKGFKYFIQDLIPLD